MDADLTVGEIAKQYAISIPAVSKHLSTLERAKLIVKRKSGKERIISINPATLESASKYLAQYEGLWTQRLDRLDALLKEEQ